MTRPRQTSPIETAPTPAPARRAWVEQIMGMPISMHLRGADVDGPAAQEAVSAQSAQIDVVSGATYTWDGYTQSLQSAIDQAHL